MPFYYMFDPTYILVIIGAVITIWASARVKSTFAKYSKVRSNSGMTGKEAAERVLHYAGITDVSVRHVSGNLTDHYDPRTKTVNLSDATYAQSSVAAVGVAAHECGHAIQHQKAYGPLSVRTAIVPLANFGSKLAWPLIIIGLIIGGTASTTLLYAGIIAFSLAVLFQIVTLPVEFNASSRALEMLDSSGILSQNELPQAKKVLGAAALTYVAGAAAAVLQLLRLVLIAGRRSD